MTVQTKLSLRTVVVMEKQYISKNSGEPCTFAQYVAEIFCYRMAVKDQKTLPPKFWNLAEWKNTFKNQIVGVNALLKLYSPDLIIKVVNSHQCRNVFSVRSPYLHKQLAVERERRDTADKLKAQSDKPALTPTSGEAISSRKPFRTNKIMEELE